MPSSRLIVLAALLVSACATRPCPGPATAPPSRMPPLAAPRLLGEHPLCEASGAAWVPCENGTGRCLLVADNERKSELFLFDVAGDTLTGQRPVPLQAPTGGSAAIKDAEGLARVGERIFVVGSHSRRSWDKTPPACTPDEQRLAFGLFDWRDGALTGTPVRTALADWQRLLQADECRRSLIVPAAPAAGLAGRLCDAIAAGQAVAEQTRDGCAQGVNVEGVAAVPGARGAAPRIWFGLRGPLLDSRAVLLRLASADALRFDAVVTLDLHGDGIRDLAVADGWLWILAGPTADLQNAGTLWRAPLAELVDGAALAPALAVAGLPPFSEAIAIDADGTALVLVDGDEENGAGDANGCPIAARYLPLTLPR